MNVSNDFEARVEAARANPQNLGALPDADGVGTVGSPGGYPYTVGVGAINAANPAYPIANFSSRGPSC